MSKEDKKSAKNKEKEQKKAAKQQAKKAEAMKPFDAKRRMLTMLYWFIMIACVLAVGWQGYSAFSLFTDGNAG